MSHASDGYVRQKGRWECFITEGRLDGFRRVSGPHNEAYRFAEVELELYPDYVMATHDFAGGQRFEVFEVVDPWETLKGDFLLVKPVHGKLEEMVMLPVSMAEPSQAPACLRDALAV